jgi:hypothetical protein
VGFVFYGTVVDAAQRTVCLIIDYKKFGATEARVNFRFPAGSTGGKCDFHFLLI